MGYGTQEFKVSVELTFCREFDVGGETPDSDVAFLDGVRVLSGDLPPEVAEIWDGDTTILNDTLS